MVKQNILDANTLQNDVNIECNPLQTFEFLRNLLMFFWKDKQGRNQYF